ncbi:unnamed protein product [Angiostrongylus costaricensis]|uniref:Secreted protein n=1 Tax=Angiostrongylus costaricensis TaxID=334426 RepID=A0A158PG84_ANGCS|nr:unnamed protein product [Angiostrongylus costaricensis]
MLHGTGKRNTNVLSSCASTAWCRQLRAGITRTLTASSAGIGAEAVQAAYVFRWLPRVTPRKNSDLNEKVVTERKCGGVEDVTGCTLYNSKISRKVSTVQSTVIDYCLH